MLLKKKSIIVALTSSIVIALVFITTLTMYLVYLEIKTRNTYKACDMLEQALREKRQAHAPVTL